MRSTARSVLLCNAWFYSLVPAQTPEDWANALVDDDWRLRNQAAIALEALPLGELPVERLVALSRRDGLPVIELPLEWNSALGLGGGVGRPDPIVALLDSPQAWLGRSWFTGRHPELAIPSRFKFFAAPVSSLLLICYVLRRTPHPLATERLLELLEYNDPSLAEQAAYSLLEHGPAARQKLIEAVGSARRGGVPLRALLSAHDAEGTVEEWVHRIPRALRSQLFDSIPPNANGLRRALAEILFNHSDEILAKDAVRVWIKEGDRAIPFLRERIRGQNIRGIHRSLATAAWIGQAARPLLDDILPLLQGRGHRSTLWAAQAIVAMAPEGADAKRTAAQITTLLATRLPTARRVALICALWACRPGASESIGILVDIARNGEGPDRSVAFSALLDLGASDHLGDDLIPMLREELDAAAMWPRTPQRRPILRAAMERLPLSDLLRAIPAGRKWYTTYKDLLQGPATDAESLARMAEWLDVESQPLREVAIAACLERIRRGFADIPEDFLATERIRPERIDERIHALLAWDGLPEPWLAKVVKILMARPDTDLWGRLIVHFGLTGAVVAACESAVRGDDDDLANAVRTAVRRAGHGEIAEATFHGWLADEDPRVRDLARFPAIRLLPVPEQIRSSWLSDLAGDHVDSRKSALNGIAMAVQHNARALDADLRAAVEGCLEHAELRDAALTILLHACMR